MVPAVVNRASVPPLENKVSVTITGEPRVNKKCHFLLLRNVLKERKAFFFPWNTKMSTFSSYLLTENEVFTGKCQTETLMYGPNDSEVDTARPRFEIFP